MTEWLTLFTLTPSRASQVALVLKNPPAKAGDIRAAAAAAAKSLQSCPTLCDPRDGGPPGSAVPGILQARTLEWVAIPFSNAWKWKVKVKSLSCVRLFRTPWTAAYQAPPSMGFSRQEYWSGLPLPSPAITWDNTIKLCPGSSVHLQASQWLSDKESACQWKWRDAVSIPRLGRSPGGGNGNSLQYSCLENPMDRGVLWAVLHGVVESQMKLSLPRIHAEQCIPGEQKI